MGRVTKPKIINSNKMYKLAFGYLFKKIYDYPQPIMETMKHIRIMLITKDSIPEFQIKNIYYSLKILNANIYLHFDVQKYK